MELLSGDLFAIQTPPKGITECVKHLYHLSLPPYTRLLPWVPCGTSHIAIVCDIWGAPAVYESTYEKRNNCIRSGGTDPCGGQAHYPEDYVLSQQHGRITHYKLRSQLYDHEVTRLRAILDYLIGRDVTLMQMIIDPLVAVGVLRTKRKFRCPDELLRYGLKYGVWDRGKVLN